MHSLSKIVLATTVASTATTSVLAIQRNNKAQHLSSGSPSFLEVKGKTDTTKKAALAAAKTDSKSGALNAVKDTVLESAAEDDNLGEEKCCGLCPIQYDEVEDKETGEVEMKQKPFYLQQWCWMFSGAVALVFVMYNYMGDELGECIPCFAKDKKKKKKDDDDEESKGAKDKAEKDKKDEEGSCCSTPVAVTAGVVGVLLVAALACGGKSNSSEDAAY